MSCREGEEAYELTTSGGGCYTDLLLLLPASCLSVCLSGSHRSTCESEEVVRLERELRDTHARLTIMQT